MASKRRTVLILCIQPDEFMRAWAYCRDQQYFADSAQQLLAPRLPPKVWNPLVVWAHTKQNAWLLLCVASAQSRSHAFQHGFWNACQKPCHTASPCPPCNQPCQAACSHGKCRGSCRDPCEPCAQPCGWKCPHQVGRVSTAVLLSCKAVAMMPPQAAS